MPYEASSNFPSRCWVACYPESDFSKHPSFYQLRSVLSERMVISTLISTVNEAMIRVFENNAGGELIQVFEKHLTINESHFYVDLVLLLGDVLCSEDEAGNIFTWHASTGKVLDTLKVHNFAAWSLMKLNDNELAVLSRTNNIIILKHEKGRDKFEKYLLVILMIFWI